MKIKSELLQKMVCKAIQGASNNKMLPITSLISIQVKDNEFTLTTTDGNNILKVKNTLADTNEEFYSVVNADQFAKLVGKTTKEYIELENSDNYLLFKANGTYKLDIAVNENGEMITFKSFNSTLFKVENEQEINLKDLQDAIRTAKASVAKTMEIPFLTGYYIGNNVVTTDRQLVCKLEKQLTKEPILISSAMADLLLLIDLDANDKLILNTSDNILWFGTKNYILYGNELEGKEDFGDKIVKAIDNLTSLSYTGSVTVNKQDLLNILDRMELFVSEYDKNGVYLRFKKDSKTLEIQSLKSNAVEELLLSDSDVIEDFECNINIEMLKEQLQSLNLDSVILEYGDQKSIQLKEGNTILVVALLDKDN